MSEEAGERTQSDVFRDGMKVVREELASSLRDQLERRPYVTLGAAAGIGYVLGGGVPKFVVRLAAGIGLRFAAYEIVKEVFAQSQPVEEDSAEDG